MEFGISFPTYIRAWEDVRRAEEYGFSNAWFDDSHMCYSEVFSTMALAADRTRRIKLGTFVLIAGNRIAPITANAMATLNEIAPGRIILGVGSGFTGRNVMGMGPRSRREIREDVAIIRDLLAGREATYREGEEVRAIKFLHPELGFINLKDRIPIYLAANAPRMQELAGEIADGWIYAGCDLKGVREGLARIKQAAEGSGRKGQIKTAIALGSTCVLRPGESLTSARVVNRVGPHAVVGLHTYWTPREIPVSMFGPPALQPLAQKYHREYLMKMKTPIEKRYQEMHLGHLIFLKPGEEQYVNEDLIREMGVSGTATQVIERIKALEEAGITQFVVRVNGTDGRELISEFGREIIAKYA